MKAIQAIANSINDAVSEDPKLDWRESLIDGLDALEVEYYELLDEAEHLRSEAKEPIAEPEPRRVMMWLGDLEGLSEEARHSGPGGTADHNLLVTLGEVVEHLNQWRK